MIPTKNNLKEEILDRISLLCETIDKVQHDRVMTMVLEIEMDVLLDVIELIVLYEGRYGYNKFLASKYTPILDFNTKEPLMIGDKVKNLKNQCGYLKFDDYMNRYVIEAAEGGHIPANKFIKIDELYDFNIDTSGTECRRQPNKKLW